MPPSHPHNVPRPIQAWRIEILRIRSWAISALQQTERPPAKFPRELQWRPLGVTNAAVPVSSNRVRWILVRHERYWPHREAPMRLENLGDKGLIALYESLRRQTAVANRAGLRSR